MRNPIPVLAAALLAAVGAFAGDLPTWTPVAEPYSAWRYVEFTDAAGTRHVLYCRWSECGSKVTSGMAPLYVLEKAGEQPYTASEPYHPQYAGTYAGKTWEWLKGKTTNVQFQSTKTTFKSEVSQFALDMSAQPNKAVIKGKNVAIPVEPEHEAVSPTGWMFIVLAPVGVADDAPKPVQTKPEPKPGHTPLPKPRPNPKPKPHPQPKPKPGTSTPAAKATELSVVEYYWMIRPERAEYDAAIDPAKKPTAAALQDAYKKAREKVAANLRDELQAPYKALVAKGDFAGIEGLLKGRNYSGFEVELRPAEYEALKKVLKTADAHTDFAKPNAAEQYDVEHRMVLASDGKVNLNEHLMAHRITEKFRGMLPKAPGQQVDPAAALTDADWAKITDKNDREAMKKQYDADFAKADTPEKKAGVNKDYRAKIDAWVKAHPPTPPASTQPFDPAKIDTLEKLMALSPEDQRKFCSMSSDSSAAGSCDDFLTGADEGMKKCLADSGANANDKVAVLKAKNDCVKKLHPTCTPGTSHASRPPLANLPKDMQTYCAKLGEAASTPPVKTNPGGSSAIDSSPCPAAKGKAGASTDAAAKKDPTTTAGSDVDPCKKADEKKDDPHFYDNLGNGLAFGIGGMLLGSFFGGPLMILAVGLAAGVGGYYFAKANDEPKKKK